MSININLPAPETPPLPAFDSTVTLDAVTYTLRFQWNKSDGAWYMRVLDEPGQVVLMGDVRLCASAPLYYSGYVDDVRFPPGYLMVIDTTGADEDPTLSTLGARHRILYSTIAEVRALGL